MPSWWDCVAYGERVAVGPSLSPTPWPRTSRRPLSVEPICPGGWATDARAIHSPHYWGSSGAVYWMAFHLLVSFGAGERRGCFHGHLLPKTCRRIVGDGSVPSPNWNEFYTNVRLQRKVLQQGKDVPCMSGVRFRNTFETVVLLLQMLRIDFPARSFGS